MKPKVSVKIDESALDNVLLEAMKSAVKDKKFDIACPHCGKEVSVPEGKSKCPSCGQTIDLSLNFKLN